MVEEQIANMLELVLGEENEDSYLYVSDMEVPSFIEDQPKIERGKKAQTVKPATYNQNNLRRTNKMGTGGNYPMRTQAKKFNTVSPQNCYGNEMFFDKQNFTNGCHNNQKNCLFSQGQNYFYNNNNNQNNDSTQCDTYLRNFNQFSLSNNNDGFDSTINEMNNSLNFNNNLQSQNNYMNCSNNVNNNNGNFFNYYNQNYINNNNFDPNFTNVDNSFMGFNNNSTCNVNNQNYIFNQNQNMGSNFNGVNFQDQNNYQNVNNQFINNGIVPNSKNLKTFQGFKPKYNIKEQTYHRNKKLLTVNNKPSLFNTINRGKNLINLQSLNQFNNNNSTNNGSNI